MVSTVSAAVVGATGFGGGELVRLLHRHPNFSPDYLTSRSFSNKPFDSVYPRFRGEIGRQCEPLDVKHLSDFDLIFFALPHGKSMEYIKEIRSEGSRIVDLAADYRLDSPETFREVYDLQHEDPEGLEEAVFGLTEFYVDAIRETDLVACPGCYVTAVLIPLYPLLDEDILDDHFFVDAKSGVSGAGRTPSSKNTFVHCHNNIRPYRMVNHRHSSEIRMVLDEFNAEQLDFSFVPHVNAMDHGIEAAIYASLNSRDKARMVPDRIKNLCNQHEFLRYFDDPPGVKSVVKTPYCDLSVALDQQRVILISNLDNLWKGAASQAIQNANLMFDRPVTEGLLEGSC